MLIPRGCCSAPMLLLRPSPTGARNGCRSLPPALARQQRSPGSSGVAVPGWCPASGQGEGRRCPLVRSCLGSPLLLCPLILSQKWEKKKPHHSPSRGVPPSAGGCAPESRGKQAKTSQEPKKKNKNPKSRGFLEEHDPLWPQPSSRRLHGSPRLRGRAGVGTPLPVPCEPSRGHPISAGAPRNTPLGCFSFPFSYKQKGNRGWAVLTADAKAFLWDRVPMLLWYKYQRARETSEADPL